MKRRLAAPLLRARLARFPAAALLGARQSGKTSSRPMRSLQCHQRNPGFLHRFAHHRLLVSVSRIFPKSVSKTTGGRIIGSMIRTHPMAADWVRTAMKELKDNQLDRWADENGGWLEAPHYAMVAYDHLLGAFLMAHNAGFSDYLYDPKMKKVGEWFAKISTPPNSELEARRHLPPIGGTYMREPSGQFGGTGPPVERQRS